MSSQIFKKDIPKNILISFFDKACVKNDKFYFWNKAAFKSAIFKDIINDFLHSIEEYYHLSKRKYLEKKDSYSGLCTIIRQICKKNNILYSSKIKYANSNYDICYYIYI